MAPQPHTAQQQGKMGVPLPFTTRPLTDAIGVEIIGLDISQALDPATVAAVKQAWYDNNILLFRHQELSETAQIRFAENFGQLAMRVPKGNGRGNQVATPILLVSNIREDGKLIGELPDGEVMFHSDQTFNEKPCSASILYGIEVPDKGGNTMFANCYRAYEALPQQVRAKLDGLKAMNIFGYDVQKARTADTGHQLRFAHPVVRTHPKTGRKALYVNRLQSVYIEGMAEAESRELLNLLVSYQEKPEFIYSHEWKKGDVLMWDNRCTLHARTDFDSTQRRLLRRVTVEGERPV